jgi:PH (Pleckstrin Homology) domain-containing protein
VASTSVHIDRFKVLHLKQNEKIELFVNGYIGNAVGRGGNIQYDGSLIITDNRVAFFHKGEFGDIFKTVPLNQITDIKRKSFLGHRTLLISTENNALIFKTFNGGRIHAIYDRLCMQTIKTTSHATGTEKKLIY